MIAISAPAPAPSVHTRPFVLPPRTERKPGSFTAEEREALADLVSLVRNVRYDLQRNRDAVEVDAYQERIGKLIIQAAQRYTSIGPRDWDWIIDQLASLAASK